MISAAKLLLTQKERNQLKRGDRGHYLIPLAKTFVRQHEIKLQKGSNIKNLC